MDCSCIKINIDPWVIISSIPSLLGNGARYLAGFGKSNTDTLVENAGRLEAINYDVEMAVVAMESRELKRRSQEVVRWMGDVAAILREVKAFAASRIYGLPCFRDCPCWAIDMLVRIQSLITEGEGLQKGKKLLGEEPLPSIYVPNPDLVDGKESLEAVRRLGRIDTIRLIGIHGMPGIGKTALLQKIYHELKAQQDQVIYAVVSKEVNILKLQKVIGEQLNLCLTDERPQDGPSPESKQAATLLVKLMDRTVTLLLDDVWELLQWENIGIPSPAEHGNGCKIIFTTPFQHICESMGVGQGTIKVSFLNDEQSWTLFCRKMNLSENDPDITDHRQVISRCGGLPRAITTFSDHMAGKSGKPQHSLHDIKLIKDRVLYPLKCVSDELEKRSIHEIEVRTREMTQCLLYCSLFPEDRSIHTDQLIDYWFGEGFLDYNYECTLPEARGEGYEIIWTLMKECFLQSVHRTDDRQVKLHDMVRCMTWWLTNGESQPPRLFLMSTRLNSTNERWEEAQRISSMGNDEKRIPSNLKRCPNLLTFLYNNHNIDHLHNQSHGSIHVDRSTIIGRPKDLFKIAGALRVLDLSGTKIDELPRDIGLMNQLHYLNLSYTKIKSLPKEVSKLRYLRQLKLRGTSHLESIPVRSISPSILQMLDLLGSFYSWQLPSQHELPRPKCIKLPWLPQIKLPWPQQIKLPWPQQINLEHFSEDTWTHLTEFGLTVKTSHSGLLKLCKCKKLYECTVFLELLDIAGLSNDHLSSVFNMKNLRELFISGSELTELKLITHLKLEILKLSNFSSLSTIEVKKEVDLKSLRHLHISNCPQLTHISWVHQLPNLLEIEMTDCWGVQELVEVHATRNPCPLSKKLREIHLINLENLMWITLNRLNSPFLEVLSVFNCPNFTHLSFDLETAANIKKISGERQWWESLDDCTKSTFQSHFIEAL